MPFSRHFLCHPGPHQLGPILFSCLWAARPAILLGHQVGRGHQGLARQVVHHLGVDMLGATVDHQARPFGVPENPLAQRALPARATFDLLLRAMSLFFDGPLNLAVGASPAARGARCGSLANLLLDDFFQVL